MRFFALFLSVCCLCSTAMASEKSVTFCLDGALVESEAISRKGYLEVSLPGNLLPNSLRIKPLGSFEIRRVDLVAGKTDPKAGKEAAALAEKKHLLEDRLKALEAREAVFRAAAKSQSSKAPRKTKTNPEPMASIRKGTEFAIAQLEEVYHARRKAEAELASVEARLVALKKSGGIGGSVARVWTSSRDGRVRVSYILSGTGWSPIYNFRLAGDNKVEVAVLADIPSVGGTARVSLSTLAELSAPFSQLSSDGMAKVATYTLPLEKEQLGGGALSHLAFTFKNTSQQILPPGEAHCYLKGEYLGKARFERCKPDESRELVFGARD
ncbi:MAG: hypothetical protein HYS23_10535 [Geobacter sp.]|nr:hypothetical protein [Geobacter sp.]